jgi:hypothetical protein
VLVVDAASCTEGLISMLAADAPDITVVDAVTYTLSTLAPKLSVRTKVERLVLTSAASARRRRVSVANQATASVPATLALGCSRADRDHGGDRHEYRLAHARDLDPV